MKRNGTADGGSKLGGMTTKRVRDPYLDAVIAAICLLCFGYPATYFYEPGVYDAIVSRKIAYCTWGDTSSKAVSYPVNSLLVVLVCLGGGLLSLGIALLVGFEKRMLPFFIIGCFIVGTFVYAPQFLAHEHYDEPSTEYFIRNVALSVVFAIALFGVSFWRRRKRERARPHPAALIGLLVSLVIAVYGFASFFYIFNAFVGIE